MLILLEIIYAHLVECCRRSGKLEIKDWLPKFYPTVLKQYEATCRGARDLFF